MKGRLILLVGSLFVITMTSGIAGVARADGPKCTPALLDGFYIFTASGFTVVGGVAQPSAIVEQIRFNGDGTADVPGGRVAVNGNIFPTLGAGTYNIAALASPNRACEGSLAFPGVNLYLFIPPDAKEIQVIRTDTSTVFRGTATLVSQ